MRPLSLSLTWALDVSARLVLDEASPTTIRKLVCTERGVSRHWDHP